MLRTVDHWIIDYLFQPVADWSSQNFGWGRVELAILTGILWPASLFVIVFVSLAHGERPIAYMIVTLVCSNTMLHRVEQIKIESTKSGFANIERESSIFRMVRLVSVVLLLKFLIQIFLGYKDIGSQVWWENAGVVAIWTHACFSACKNSPPRQRKQVKVPLEA